MLTFSVICDLVLLLFCVITFTLLLWLLDVVRRSIARGYHSATEADDRQAEIPNLLRTNISSPEKFIDTYKAGSVLCVGIESCPYAKDIKKLLNHKCKCMEEDGKC